MCERAMLNAPQLFNFIESAVSFSNGKQSVLKFGKQFPTQAITVVETPLPLLNIVPNVTILMTSRQ